jgi:hypothetical protein
VDFILKIRYRKEHQLRFVVRTEVVKAQEERKEGLKNNLSEIAHGESVSFL